MRNFTLLLFLFLTSVTFAQSNAGRFFEDGKYWICHNREVKISVAGDTIVGGVTARKLQSEIIETGEKSKGYQIGYENDGKIYFWINNGFRLFYDYNVKGTYQVCDYYGEPVDGYEVLCSLDGIYNIEGINRRIFSATHLIFGDIRLGLTYWIEGIGTDDEQILLTQNVESIDNDIIDISVYDPAWPTYVDECYLYDKCLFNSDKFYDYLFSEKITSPDLSSIEEIGNDEVNEAVYDLMGRKVTHPQPGHIYITPSGKRIY